MELMVGKESGMDDGDEIAQETVWMEGDLFVIVRIVGVAAVDMSTREGVEARIRRVFGSERRVGHIYIGIILDKP